MPFFKRNPKSDSSADSGIFTVVDSPSEARAHARGILQQLMRRQHPTVSSDASSAAGSAGLPQPPQQQPSKNFPWSIRRLILLPPIMPRTTLGSQDPSPSPFPRYGHSLPLTAAANGELYLFGGVAGESINSDLYLISTKDLSAALLHTVGDLPSPRVGHASAFVSTILIVWGGDTGQSGPSGANVDDRIYLLDTPMRKWTSIATKGPVGRYGHTATTAGTKLFVFAGQVTRQFLNDLWAFDLNSLVNSAPIWEEYRPANNRVPNARAGHICVAYDGKIYLFGGTDSQYVYNDTWAFDVTTRTWKELNCVGSIPEAREGHAAALVDDVIYIFGGRGVDGEDLGDLDAFKISSQRWYTFINMGPKPSQRSGHAMASSGSRVFVLGGGSFSETGKGKINVIHVLDTKRIKYPGPVDTHAQNLPNAINLSNTINLPDHAIVHNIANPAVNGGLPDSKGAWPSDESDPPSRSQKWHWSTPLTRSAKSPPILPTPSGWRDGGHDYGYDIINMYTQGQSHAQHRYNSPRLNSPEPYPAKTSFEEEDQTRTSESLEPFSTQSKLYLDGQIKNRSKHVVASGGYADIWTGLLGSQTVAIKTMRAFSSMGTPIQRSKLLKRIWREYLVWSPLSHPNVLKCLGFTCDFTSDSQSGVPSLISPWMPNRTVPSYVEANPNVNRLEIVVGIAKGLSYLHDQDRAIVHGDIRAGNILVSDAGVPCLTDFGLSRILSDAGGMTTSSEVAGSLRWMAPELLHGDKITVSSDVWAYGMTVLEIMSGKRPYNECDRDPMVLHYILDGRAPLRPMDDDTQSSLPEWMWEACLQCWHVQPTQRPSMHQVMIELGV